MSKPVAALAILALFAAGSQQPGIAQHKAAQAPPTQNGVYVSHEICPGEGGCPWKHWRANKPVDLHASKDAKSSVIATLKPGEWAQALGGETRLVPVRGVVRRTIHDLKPGAVVYRLGSAGEGAFQVWHRGKIVELQSPDDDDAVNWSARVPPANSSLGWWVHVKRERDGVTGWVLKPDGFDCMGPLAGDDGCRG